MKTVDGGSVRELVQSGLARLSPGARARITELGIPLDGKIAATYPATAWAGCVAVMAEDMFPSLDPIEAQRKLAHLRIGEVAGSWRGRALFAVSKLAGRERALEKFVHGLRRATNYLETRFTVVAPRHYEVWLSEVTGVPGFFLGMIEAAAGRFASDPAPIRIASRDGDACTYEIG